MLLMLKLLKIKFNDCLTTIVELRISIPGNERYFKEMLRDVDIQISVIRSQVRLVLQSLFGKNYFLGFNETTFWGLTKEDLEKGYLKLTEGIKGEIYILTLTDTKQVKAGTLVKVNKVSSGLKSILVESLQANLYSELPDINKSLLSKPLKIRKG